MLRTADRDKTRLLSSGDPAPVEWVNADGRSELFLTCEHAGRAVPLALGDLGVPAAEMDRHIAYDVGAEGLSRLLSARLDAALVLQRYSRLVIDCNRPLSASDCFVETSDGTAVPANTGLDQWERKRRYVEIHQPLHEAITVALDQRRAAGRPTVLVSVHSFTPLMRATGAVRDFELGLLHNSDRRLADALAEAFRAENPDITVRLNAPYIVDDESDFTIPVHGEKRGIAHVLLEVRNDLISDARGQEAWAARLGPPLERAVTMLEETADGR